MSTFVDQIRQAYQKSPNNATRLFCKLLASKSGFVPQKGMAARCQYCNTIYQCVVNKGKVKPDIRQVDPTTAGALIFNVDTGRIHCCRDIPVGAISREYRGKVYYQSRITKTFDQLQVMHV